MMKTSAAFVLHLVQDVNILRPLIIMAARDFDLDPIMLVSHSLISADVTGIWEQEIEDIAAASGVTTCNFGDVWSAVRELKGRQGLLFSASESTASNHAVLHELYLAAPPTFTRVTVQHGYECVGFRHSAAHTRRHGETVTFAADLLCTWAEVEHLPDLSQSQQPKAVVTGPPLVLQQKRDAVERTGGPVGLICENLHSVRFANAAEARQNFLDQFVRFAREGERIGHSLVLRPHPSGQYFLRDQIPLPANVSIESSPTYRVDLTKFAYAVSAPSSVLVELLVADVPTAVWVDPDGTIDARSYEGLTTVSSVEEMLIFAKRAAASPDECKEAQHAFLKGSGLLLDPSDIFARYAQIFLAEARSVENFTQD